VKTGSEVYYVADPIKRIEKLGAMQPYESEEKMRELHISFCDIMRNYDDEAVLVGLESAVKYRYNTSAHIMPGLSGLASLTKSYDKFRRVYEEYPTITEM